MRHIVYKYNLKVIFVRVNRAVPVFSRPFWPGLKRRA